MTQGSPERGPDGAVEWFEAPSGRLIGAAGLVFLGVLLAVAVLDGLQGKDLPVAAGFGFAATAIWAVLLRPRVGLGPDVLVLRRPLSTITLPLAAIEQVALRQVLAVLVAEKRYVATGLGRSRRSLARHDGRARGRKDASDADYAAFVSERMHARMEDARARAGVALLSDEQLALAAGVRTRPAWPEITLLALTALLWLLGLIF